MPALASPGPHAALSTTQDHPVSPFPGLQPWFLSPTLRDPCVLASISPRLIPPDQPLWGLLTTVLPGVVGRLFLLEAFPDHHTLSESTKALTVYTHAGYPVHMGSTPLNGPNHVSVGGRSQWAPERSHVHLKRCFLLGAHFVGLPSRRPVAGLCVCIFILEQSQVIQCHLWERTWKQAKECRFGMHLARKYFLKASQHPALCPLCPGSAELQRPQTPCPLHSHRHFNNEEISA